jgi:hypothetical protein
VTNWNTIQRHDRCIDLKIYYSIRDGFNFAEKSSIANIAKLKPSWIFANLQYSNLKHARIMLTTKHLFNINSFNDNSCMLMKWPRYRRVISLESQVGVTSQINKWANTDPRKYRRWDQVHRRSEHPLPTGRTRHEPVPLSWMRSYPLSKSVCQVRSNYWNEKCQTTYGSRKVCNYELDHCNGHRTCETPTSNETANIPVLSTCLSVVYPDLKIDCM